ncbi:UNVERIFIED_CONTAM: ribonuclease HI protein [Hammondia hammondi]|eukprot:XP_008887967.1 ribonuclease HI protein [Hammondia hammondi]
MGFCFGGGSTPAFVSLLFFVAVLLSHLSLALRVTPAASGVSRELTAPLCPVDVRASLLPPSAVAVSLSPPLQRVRLGSSLLEETRYFLEFGKSSWTLRSGRNDLVGSPFLSGAVTLLSAPLQEAVASRSPSSRSPSSSRPSSSSETTGKTAFLSSSVCSLCPRACVPRATLVSFPLCAPASLGRPDREERRVKRMRERGKGGGRKQAGSSPVSTCFFAIRSGPTRVITTSREDAQKLFSLFLKSSHAEGHEDLSSCARGNFRAGHDGNAERVRHTAVQFQSLVHPKSEEAKLFTQEGRNLPNEAGGVPLSTAPRGSSASSRTPSPVFLSFSISDSREEDAKPDEAHLSDKSLDSCLSSPEADERRVKRTRRETEAAAGSEAGDTRRGKAGPVEEERSAEAETRHGGKRVLSHPTEEETTETDSCVGCGDASWEIVRKATLREALSWLEASFSSETEVDGGDRRRRRNERVERRVRATRESYVHLSEEGRKAGSSWGESGDTFLTKAETVNSGNELSAAPGAVPSSSETGEGVGRLPSGSPSWRRRKTRGPEDRFETSYSPSDGLSSAGVRVETKETPRREGGGSFWKTQDAASTPARVHDDARILYIYTDGACRSNGRGKEAKAGVGVFFGDGDPRNVSRRLTGQPQTNQRAELQAILDALLLLKAWEEAGRGFWGRASDGSPEMLSTEAAELPHSRRPSPRASDSPQTIAASEDTETPDMGSSKTHTFLPATRRTRGGSLHATSACEGDLGGRSSCPGLGGTGDLFFSEGDPLEMRICSDSVYAVRCVTEWVTAWKANGWRTSAGTEVRNRDLIAKIHELLQSRKRGDARFSSETSELKTERERESRTSRKEQKTPVQGGWGGRGTIEFVLIKGHSGNYGNEKADQLACLGTTLPSEGEEEIRG